MIWTRKRKEKEKADKKRITRRKRRNKGRKVSTSLLTKERA